MTPQNGHAVACFPHEMDTAALQRECNLKIVICPTPEKISFLIFTCNRYILVYVHVNHYTHLTRRMFSSFYKKLRMKKN